MDPADQHRVALTELQERPWADIPYQLQTWNHHSLPALFPPSVGHRFSWWWRQLDHSESQMSQWVETLFAFTQGGKGLARELLMFAFSSGVVTLSAQDVVKVLWEDAASLSPVGRLWEKQTDWESIHGSAPSFTFPLRCQHEFLILVVFWRASWQSPSAFCGLEACSLLQQKLRLLVPRRLQMLEKHKQKIGALNDGS